ARSRVVPRTRLDPHPGEITMRWLVMALALVSLATLPPAAARAQTAVVKLATLVPEGSVWDKALREMGAEWTTATQGRVKLQVYPGGVAVEELRKVKMFCWAGDDRAVQRWKAGGFLPVALAATDIMTGLQTGMIEAYPTTPLLALTLQWYRMTPNMVAVGMAPLVGGLVIT